VQFKAVPSAKRALILERGPEPFKTFFHQLTPIRQQKVFAHLPKPKGFRPGSPSANAKKVQDLFSSLESREGGQDAERAWTHFYMSVFLNWIASHPDLARALHDFDNAADFAEDMDDVPPNTELDVACFERLAEVSAQGELAREDIQQFYDYGYFLPDPRIEAAIASSKTAEEVQQIDRMRRLPQDIEVLQQRSDAMDSRLDDLATRVASTDASVQAVTSTFEHTSGQTASTLATVQKTLEAALPGNTLNALTQRLTTVETTVADLPRQWQPTHGAATAADVEAAVAAVALLASQVEDLVVALQDLRTTCAADSWELGERIIQVEQITASLGQALTEATKVTAHAEAAPLGGGSGHDPPWPSAQAKSDLLVHRMPAAMSATPLTVDSVLDCLENNLAGAGLNVHSARTMAREILAGLAAGQLVSFRGSLASVIASICAQTFAASHQYVVHVPVGLLGSDDFGQHVAEIVAACEQRDTMSVLTMEGLNRAALEAYGDSLCALVDARFLHLDATPPNLLLLATVVDGPSALPVSPIVCELGPILDVDAYVWASTWTPKHTAGIMPSHVWWSEVTREGPAHEHDVGELKELRQSLELRSIRWRRCVDAAYRCLAGVRTHSRAPSVLESLVFGWVLPYALARRLDLERVRRVLVEHGIASAADGVDGDKRIRRVLQNAADLRGES